MRIHLRVEVEDPGHTTFTMFMNGGNCGTLTMRNDEFNEFRDILTPDRYRTLDHKFEVTPPRVRHA